MFSKLFQSFSVVFQRIFRFSGGSKWLVRMLFAVVVIGCAFTYSCYSTTKKPPTKWAASGYIGMTILPGGEYDYSYSCIGMDGIPYTQHIIDERNGHIRIATQNMITGQWTKQSIDQTIVNSNHLNLINNSYESICRVELNQTNDETGILQVFSCNGTLLIRQQIDGAKEYAFNTMQYPTGQYFVTYKSENKQLFSKFQIVR